MLQRHVGFFHLFLINNYKRKKKQSFKSAWENYNYLPNLTLQQGIPNTENSTNQDLQSCLLPAGTHFNY